MITQEFDMKLVQYFEKMQALPPDKQAEVFDFIEFLVMRSSIQVTIKPCLAEWLLVMPDVGLDEDFARVDESEVVGDVFN